MLMERTMKTFNVELYKRSFTEMNTIHEEIVENKEQEEKDSNK